MSDENSGETVQVFVRIRPEEVNTSNVGSKCASLLDERTIRLTPPDGTSGLMRKAVSAVDDRLFSFDKIFPETCTQEDIYKNVSTYVKATVRGYNTTIFAYGSTGSGKSYTMTGTSACPGIIPRAISEIFSIIETTAAQEQDVFFYVRLSYVELYNNNFRNLLEFASKELKEKENCPDDNNNNNINDLLNDSRVLKIPPPSQHPGFSQRNEKIEVRESQSAGVFLAGPNLRIPVTTAQEAFQLIARGNRSRATGSTQCNDVSSRSHAILTLHVESRIASQSTTNLNQSNEGSLSPELRLGKMHLVDLAGSERITLSGAEGETLVETQNINLSLTALGDVLSALSRNAMIMIQHEKGGKSGKLTSALVPVPYRNSKLTHLLKDSLGGNSKTIMLTNIRTLSEYYQQTVVALMYASRAKKVRNRSLVNRNVIGDTGIHAVSSEIERLKSRLDERTVEFERLRLLQLKDAKENMSLKSRLQELNEMNEAEKKQLEAQMSNVIHSQAGQLAAQKDKISSLQNALQEELAISHNRIAEQEREIKWLKRALEDTAQAAQQPIEKMERMQKVVDAWQSQATNSQQELQNVTSEVEKLKHHNAELMNELTALKSSKLQLQDELNSKVNDLEHYSNALQEKEYENEKLMRLRENLHAECEDAKQQWRTYAEIAKNSDIINQELKQNAVSLQNELDERQKATNSLTEKAVAKIKELEKSKNDLQEQFNEKQKSTDSLIERATIRIKELEKEKIDLQNELNDTKKSLTEGASVRINELEQEKVELQNKLGDTVRDLEERTASALQGAMTKCQTMDAKSKAEEERANKAESQLQMALNKIESIQLEMASNFDIVDGLKASVDELEELNRNLKNQLASQEQSYNEQLITIESELQSMKHIESEYTSLLDEYKNINDKVISLEMSLVQKQSSFSILEKANNELTEELKLLTEAQLRASSDRDNILKIQNESHLKNLEDMKIAEIQRETKMREKFQEEFNKLNEEFSKKENDYINQISICDTEAQKKAHDTIQTHMETLEYEHEKILKQIFNDSKLELQKELLRQKEDIDSYWNSIILQKQCDYEQDKENTIDDMNSNFQHEKDSLIKSYEALVMEMKESLGSVIIKNDEQLASEQLKCKELLKELEQAKNNDLVGMKTNHEQLIDKMKQDHDIAIKNTIDKMKHDHDIAIKNIQDKISKAHNDVKKANDEQNKIKEELEKYKLQSKQHINDIESDSQQRITDIESQYKSEINELKELYEEKINTLQIMIESIKDLRKEEIDRLNATHENEIEKCNHKYNLEIENLKRELSEANIMNDQTIQSNQKHQLIQEKYRHDLEALQKDLQETREKSFHDLNQIQKENQSILEGSLQAAEAKLEQCLLKQRQQLESTHQKELVALKEKILQGQQSLLSEAKENHSKELRELVEEHGKELQDTVAACERKIQMIQSSQEQTKRIELSQLNEALSIEQVKALEKQRQDLENLHKTHIQQIVSEMKSLHTVEQANLEDRRLSEVDALQKELQFVIQSHQSSLADLDIQHSTKLERDLSDQKIALDSKYKTIIAEKNQSIQSLHEQISSIKMQHQEELSHALGGQQERHIEHHRTEIEKLRNELGDAEMRHQKELTETVNQHLQELSSQRQQLDSIHNKVILSLNQEITSVQERYNQAIAAAAQRHSEDTRALTAQREEFEKVMQSNMNDRETHNKYIIQNMIDNHQLEFKRLQSLHDNESAKLQSDFVSKERQWKIDAQKAEISQRQQYTQDLSAIEIKHSEALAEQLSSMMTKHKNEMKVLENEKDAIDSKYKSLIASTSDQQNEIMIKLTKQQEVFEREKEELLDSSRRELINSEKSYNDSITIIEEKFKDQEKNMKQVNDEIIASLHEQYNKQITTLRNDLDNERLSFKEQLALFEEQRQQSEKDKERMYNEHITLLKEQIEELNNTFASENDAINDRSIQLSTALKEQYAKLETAKIEYDALLSSSTSMKNEYDALLSSSSSLQSKYDKLQDVIKANQESHDTEMKTLKQANNDDITKYKELVIELEKTAEDLKASSEAALEKEKIAMESIDSARQALKSSQDELNKKSEELKRVQAKNAEDFLLLEAESRKQINELQKNIISMTDEMTKLNSDLNHEREQNNKYSKEINDQREEVIHQIELLVRKNHDEIQIIKEEEARKVREFQFLNENLLQSLSQKDNTIEELQRKLSIEIVSKEEEMSDLIRKKEELVRLVEIAEKKFLAIQQKYEDHISDASTKDDLLRLKEQQHQAELISMKNKFESDKEAALNAIKGQMKQLQKELTEAEGIYSAEWANLRDSIKIEQTKYQTESASLKQQLNDSNKLMTDLKSIIHQKEADHSNTTNELQVALRENTRLQLEMNNKENELRLEIEEKLRIENHEVIQKLMKSLDNSNHQCDELKQYQANDLMKIKELEKVAVAYEELKANHEQTVKDLEAAFKSDVKEQLALSQADIQGGHMNQLQQQMDTLMAMVLSQANSNQPQSIPQDMQLKFMEIIQDLPDMWRKKHTFVPGGTTSTHTQQQSQQQTSVKVTSKQKGPIYTPVDDSKSISKKGCLPGPTPKLQQTVPWSSPALVSSPTDQLIAAILDGDVQGIRTVVRSKGEGLNSEFWKDLSKSILPLHRAISGLHFHGSERLLVSTIETLSQLGADVNETDHTGNTVLHKAIQVCTSKSVAAVVSTLLSRGAHSMSKNKDGDTPIHAECKRVRTASVEVLELLIQEGADPNSKSNHNMTPLTQILQRGAASAAVAVGSSFLYGTGYDDNLNDENQEDGLISGDTGRTSGRRVWVKAAEFLVRSGAKWDANWRGTNGCNQLYLLLAAFPPATSDFGSYRYLVSTSLEAGLSPGDEDDKGRNGLFALCEQMAGVSTEICPDANKILRMILDGCGLVGVGGSDRSGRTVFDIPDRVSFSCLASARPLLVEATMKSATNTLDTLDAQNNSIITSSSSFINYENETPTRKFGQMRTISSSSSSSSSSKPTNRSNIKAKESNQYSSSSSSSSILSKGSEYIKHQQQYNNNNNIENIRNINNTIFHSKSQSR